MTSLDEVRALVDNPDLIAVGMMGDEARRAIHGARTTFLRVFEVHCGAVPAALPSSMAAGEIRIVGVPPSFEAAEAAARGGAALAGNVPLSGFSLADLLTLAGSPDALAALCSRLAAAGLAAIAEAPVDRLGADAQAAVAAARGAGLSVDRLTVHGPQDGIRLDVLEAARALQAALGGFAALAPLPRTLSISTPTTGYDDVKQIAAARLLVANIRSIQVDWPLYGPKLAQVALTMGADDVDGVLAADAGALGPRRSAIEEIRGNIRAAGLEPVERNGRWEAIGA